MKPVDPGERPRQPGLSTFQAIILAFGLWVLLGLLSRALWVLALVALALVLAAALMPLVGKLRSVPLPPRGWHLPVPVALLLIYLVGALLFGAFLYFAVPVLLTELTSFALMAPEQAEALARRFGRMADSAGVTDLLPSARQVADVLQSGLLGFLRTATTATFEVFGLAIQALVVLTLAFLFVVHADELVSFWVELFAPSQRQRVRDLTSEIGRTVGSWVLAQLAIVSIIGALAGVGAGLLGLPYAVLLGVTTAVIDLVPTFGPSAMALPAGILGLTESPLKALATVAFFVALGQLEGQILTPLIAGRAVRISPVLIVIAVPLGLALYGPIGALLSIPSAATLHILVKKVVLPWLHRYEEAETDSSPGS